MKQKQIIKAIELLEKLIKPSLFDLNNTTPQTIKAANKKLQELIPLLDTGKEEDHKEYSVGIPYSEEAMFNYQTEINKAICKNESRPKLEPAKCKHTCKRAEPLLNTKKETGITTAQYNLEDKGLGLDYMKSPEQEAEVEANQEPFELINSFVKQWNEEISKDNEMYCITEDFVKNFKNTSIDNFGELNYDKLTDLKKIIGLED